MAQNPTRAQRLAALADIHYQWSQEHRCIVLDVLYTERRAASADCVPGVVHLPVHPPATDPLGFLRVPLLVRVLRDAGVGRYRLTERMGTSLDAAHIAAMDPDAFIEHFRAKPSLHRYPKSMGARAQKLCQHIVDEHGGKAAAAPFSDTKMRSVADIDGPEALERVRAHKKALKAQGKGKDG